MTSTSRPPKASRRAPPPAPGSCATSSRSHSARTAEPARSAFSSLLQRRGVLGRAAVVQHQVRARGVQRARDLGAHAPGRAGDQDRLARQAVHADIGRWVVVLSWGPIMTASARAQCCRRCRRRNCATAARSAALIRAEVQRGRRLAVVRALHGAGAVCARGSGTTAPAPSSSARGGDFVTAPEVSDLFSRCVARQCARGAGRTGGRDPRARRRHRAHGGGGADARWHAGGVLPERYAILEVSADLAERQRAHLARAAAATCVSGCVWLDAPAAEPAVRGVILANEVADALPCRRFTLQERRACASSASRSASRRAPCARLPEPRRADSGAGAAACAACAQLCRRRCRMATRRRCACASRPGSQASRDCLARGALLLFDYGLPRRHYYHPQRVSGTLRCHFRQRVHDDPYINVGRAGHHRLGRLHARGAGGRGRPGLDGGRLCHAGGVSARPRDWRRWWPRPRTSCERARLAGEARRLIMPEEMGEAFKVMALTRGYDAPLAGFALQDLRHLL